MRVLLESAAFAAAFVASVYAFPMTRTARERDRDSTPVVRRRLIAIVALSCVSVPVARIMYYGPSVSTLQFVQWMLYGRGRPAPSSVATAVWDACQIMREGVALTSLLFAGPLSLMCCNALRRVFHAAQRGSLEPLLPHRILREARSKTLRDTVSQLLQLLSRPTELRNYVVGPLTEEVVLRYAPLLCLESAAFRLASSFPGRDVGRLVVLNTSIPRSMDYIGGDIVCSSFPRRVTWLTFLFVAAHWHHAVRYYYVALEDLELPGTSHESRVREAVRRALFSLLAHSVVTGLFGLLGAMLLAHSNGAILSPFAAHAFCNWMGPPSFSYLTKARSDVVPCDATSETSRVSAVPPRIVQLERIFISVMHVLGIVAFFRAL